MWMWVRSQSQAGAALDVKAGTSRYGLLPQHQQGASAAQALSVPVKGLGYHQAKSGVEYLYHLYSVAARLCVPGCNHRLVQSQGTGMAVVEHDGCRVLCRLFGRSYQELRRAGNLQYRPGLAVSPEPYRGDACYLIGYAIQPDRFYSSAVPGFCR
jgi:hypothetical protein